MSFGALSRQVGYEWAYLETIPHRYMTSSEIDQKTGDEKRRDFFVTLRLC